MTNVRSRAVALAPIVAGLLLLVIAGSSPADESKKTIQFQARITNNGLPVNGTLNLTFRVYSQPSGAAGLLWEADHLAVPVKNGIFSVRLGSVGPNPTFPPLDAVFKDDGSVGDRWVAVVLDGDEIVVPRIKLTAVPYAVNAVSATTATLSSQSEFADFAGHADTAASAAVATTALTADSSLTANYATTASHAGTADSAAVTTLVWDAASSSGKSMADMDQRFGPLLGQAGGQTLNGGTGVADDLTLKSSSIGTGATGFVVLGSPSKLDGVNWLTQGTATPTSAPSGYTGLYAKAGGLFYYHNGTETQIGSGGGGSGGAVLPQINGGRLSLSSTDPAPAADQTSKTTLYFLPYIGNTIAIYDGTAWGFHALGSSGISRNNSGLSYNKNYDVFVYAIAQDNLALQLDAWSSDTVRATALVRQDGVYVKSGQPTRRYVGTIRIDGSLRFNDANRKRLVWNWQNRIHYADSGDGGSWSVNTYNGYGGFTGWVDAGGGWAGFRSEVVLGLDTARVSAKASIMTQEDNLYAMYIAAGSINGAAGPGPIPLSGNGGNYELSMASMSGAPGKGYVVVQVKEAGNAATTPTYTNQGQSGPPSYQQIFLQTYQSKFYVLSER